MRLDDKPTENSLGKYQATRAIPLETRGRAQDAGAVCRKFEGFLLGELFKQMREGEISGKGIIPVSRAESIFIRQQCETLGDLLAERGPLGLARLLGSQVDGKQTVDGGAHAAPNRTGETTDAH